MLLLILSLLYTAGDYAYNYAVNINYMTPNSNVIETLRDGLQTGSLLPPGVTAKILGIEPSVELAGSSH